MSSTEAASRTAANVATVGSLYEAFGRGDMETIVGLIAEDCRWEDWGSSFAQRAGISYLQPQRGPQGVAAFFAIVATFEIHDFQVLDLFGGERQVAVEVLLDATSPGGGRFRDEELHLYTLGEDGKIVRMRHYVDTAKHIAAWGGEDTTA